MMNKSPNLTNQELLKDLKDRLPNFTYDELYFLLAIIQPYQERVLKIIQDNHPKVYGWIRAKQQQLEQEKTDEQAEKLKKSLKDQK